METVISNPWHCNEEKSETRRGEKSAEYGEMVIRMKINWNALQTIPPLIALRFINATPLPMDRDKQKGNFMPGINIKKHNSKAPWKRSFRTWSASDRWAPKFRGAKGYS